MTTEPWASVGDVSKHLGVAKDSVYRWIDARSLPAHRIGRLRKFKLSESTSGYELAALKPTTTLRAAGARDEVQLDQPGPTEASPLGRAIRRDGSRQVVEYEAAARRVRRVGAGSPALIGARRPDRSSPWPPIAAPRCLNPQFA
jgi:excisionase family DNA binding protein